MVFDPFGDFESAGYLRNIERLKDRKAIKVLEHAFFEANLEKALSLLEELTGPVEYVHFLEVHRILFGEFYPWAGQDRQALGVGRLGAGRLWNGDCDLGTTLAPCGPVRVRSWGHLLGATRSWMGTVALCSSSTPL